MNYPLNNGGYGQQSQNMQLPYSTTQVQFPFIPLQPGVAPFIPNGLQIPSPLQQLVPLIVYEGIHNIQIAATQSALRVFFFNQMAANGFSNNEFIQFINGLTYIIDLRMRTLNNADVQRVITQTAIDYTEYKVAMNAAVYPALTTVLPQEAMTAINNCINSFNVHVGQMEQVVNRPMVNQQNTGVPQNMIGMPIGQPNNQAYGMLYNGGNNSRPPDRYIDNFNSQNNRPVPNVSTMPIVTNLQHTQQNSTYTPRSSPEVLSARNAIRDTTPVKQVSVSAQDTNRVELERVVPIYRESNNFIPSKDFEGWKRSDTYPVTLAYDINTSELMYAIAPDGTVIPKLLKKAENMERDKHLKPPSLTPAWATNIPMETPISIDANTGDEKPLSISDMTFLQPPCPPTLTTKNSNDNWAFNEAALRLEIERHHKRRHYIASESNEVETVAASKEILSVVDSLIDAVNEEEAVSIIKHATEINSLTDFRTDVKALAKINDRLTKRVNVFIKNELGLASGTITNYAEDILELIPYLKETYGDSVSECLRKSHRKILKESLNYATGEMNDAINSCFYEKLVIEKEDDFVLINFYENNLFVSVDLSVIELKIELPVTKHSVGILKEELPLLYEIAERAYKTVTSNDRNNCYIRTADDITYRITTGAFNSNFYLISLVE